jgi:hypothetical protein
VRVYWSLGDGASGAKVKEVWAEGASQCKVQDHACDRLF